MHPDFITNRTVLTGLLSTLVADATFEADLNDKELEFELLSALDTSQEIRSISEHMNSDGFVNVDLLALFKLNPGEKMVDQVKRHTLGEAIENERRTRLGMNPHIHPGKQAFYDLRQTFLHLGLQYDEQRLRHIIKDPDDTSVICIRIVEIRRAIQTPLFLVLYCHDLKGRLPAYGLPWIENLIGSDPVPMTRASIEEQHLLLRLLDQNAQRVPPTLQRAREPTEKHFRLSFLLPVRPLLDADRNLALERPDACAVCGVSTTSNCSGCRAIRYCSPEHAKLNWRSHKSVCKSLTGATWITLPFDPADLLERSTNDFRPVIIFDRKPSTAPPNPYGSQPFVLKFQRPVGVSCDSIDIWDRTGALELTVYQSKCSSDVWSKIQALYNAQDMLQGVKLYVWARRKSDTEFYIAIDRLPDQQILSW